MKYFDLKDYCINAIRNFFKAPFHNKKRGFSLIEVAIAIVIMGLIVSITSRGKELVHSTKLRSVSEQINTFRMSAQLFMDKYNAIPGDLSNAKEVIDHSLENGSGSGNITSLADAKRFWKQLVASGLLNVELVDGFPASSLGGYYSVSTNVKGNEGVWIVLSRGTTDNEHYAGIVSQEEAYFIDKKYDTGVPSSGDIRTFKISDGTHEPLKAYDIQSKKVDCIIMFKLF